MKNGFKIYASSRQCKSIKHEMVEAIKAESHSSLEKIDLIPRKRDRRRATGGRPQTAMFVLCMLAMMVTTGQVMYFHQSAIPDHNDARQLDYFLEGMKKVTELSHHAEPNAWGASNSTSGQRIGTTNSLQSGSSPGSNPFAELLKKAGESVPDELWQKLEVVHNDWTHLYGTNPVILGTETCAKYRELVPQKKRILAVAGLFNTGTNAMEFHLRKNVMSVITKWQVPWGKHRDPRVRLQHVAPGMDKVPQKDVLPIVIVRDPLHWMQSMCRSPYAAKWKKTKLHCPNLVPTPNDLSKFAPALRESNNTFPVTVHFDKNQVISWPSLVHLYSDWYRQYLDADYPHLIVRFEDMLWQAPAILDQISDCVGTKRADPISYQVKSSKGHGSGTGLVKAILKSGNITSRHGQLTQEDLVYAAENTDSELLDLLKYSIPKGFS